MEYVLIPIAVILIAMVVFSLFRGLNAFRQSLHEDAGRDRGEGATELQLRQNRMMWARIKYQLAAVVVVGLLLLMAR
jgi:hypothetical protein